jgi:NAD(P)H-hydrate epimerase
MEAIRILLQNKIPVISKDQMIEVDRLMTECYGISLLQMMENAGRNLAIHAKNQMDVISDKTNICVVIGKGNNGGGGLVAARHLSNWGANVTVLIVSSENKFKEIAAKQFEIINHLPISVVITGKNSHHIEWNKCDLIIDALLGYGLNRKPEGIVAETIKKINYLNCPVLSLDIPSGLDSNKGYISDIVVKATSTLTLALPKEGLINSRSVKYVGDLYLADISVPPLLYCQLGLKVPPIFSQNTIIPFKMKKRWPSEPTLF